MNRILIFLLSTLCLGCFDVEVDVKERPFDKKIVVGASLNLLDTVHHIYIGQNKSYLGEDNFTGLEKTQVLLSDPSDKQYLFTYIPNWQDSIVQKGNYGRLFRYNFKYIGLIDTKPGTYKIKVLRDGYPDASANTPFIENVHLDSYEIESLGTDNSRILIKWKDPIKNDYYRFSFNKISILDKIEFSNTSYISTNDLSANDFFTSGISFLINDEAYNGKLKNMVFNIKSTDDIQGIFKTNRIKWDVITKEEYEFEKQSRLNEEASRNPYLNVDIAKGNIQNGLGLFTIGYSNKYDF